MAGVDGDGAADRTEMVLRIGDDGLDEHRNNRYTPTFALADSEAALVVTRGPSAGSCFRLDGGRVEVGRGDVDIPLTDHTVSRRHAAVERVGQDFWIEDLDSLNGVLVNGRPVKRARLVDGDRLQIGLFKLLFFAHGTAA